MVTRPLDLKNDYYLILKIILFKNFAFYLTNTILYGLVVKYETSIFEINHLLILSK